MISDRDAAEGQHPAAQVVVDVLEQHGGTGGDGRRVVEVELRRLPLHEHRRLALVLDGRVPREPGDDLRGVVVDEDRAQGLPHLTLVVVEEELHPLRVVERALGRRDRGQAAERLHRVLAAGDRGGRPGLLLRLRREQRLGRDAVGRVAVGARHQGVGELEDGERAHHRLDLAARLQPVVEVLQLLGTVTGEELVDLVTGIHRDHGEHRLATEQALVDDVVLVDLGILVEVAVLPRGEVELGDPETEGDRDQEPHHGHHDRVLAELHRDVGPESLHHFPRGDVTRRSVGSAP